MPMRRVSAHMMARTVEFWSSARAASVWRFAIADSTASADGVCRYPARAAAHGIGREVLRRVLMAYDGRLAWTPLLRRVFERHGSASHAIVQWAAQPYLAAS